MARYWHICLLLKAFSSASTQQIDPRYSMNLTVYHQYEPSYEFLGLRDQNTGDVRGDAFFVLRGLMLPVECSKGRDTPLVKHDCDNPEQNETDTNVVSQHLVEVDSRFGDYGECNVNGNTKSYSCECGALTQLVPCDGFVGMADVGSRYDHQHLNASNPAWQWWRANLAKKFGGKWYSTTGNRECKPFVGATASPCYWRLVRTESRISSRCLLQTVTQVIRLHSPDCFSTCVQPTNDSSACVATCYMDGILGPHGGTQRVSPKEGMAIAPLLAAWHHAFTHCPQIPGDEVAFGVAATAAAAAAEASAARDAHEVIIAV